MRVLCYHSQAVRSTDHHILDQTAASEPAAANANRSLRPPNDKRLREHRGAYGWVRWASRGTAPPAAVERPGLVSGAPQTAPPRPFPKSNRAPTVPAATTTRRNCYEARPQRARALLEGVLRMDRSAL